MRSTLIAMLALPAVGFLGCPDETSGPAARLEGDPVVDARSGTVMNVELGDSAREIRRALGEPAARETRPIEEVGLPWIVEDPPARGGQDFPASLAYADVDILTTRESGAYAVSIWREGVRTSRGVAIGDPLARAREEYDGLTCDVRNRNTEYVAYPYCRGHVGGHAIWFGRDPIESITIATVGLG